MYVKTYWGNYYKNKGNNFPVVSAGTIMLDSVSAADWTVTTGSTSAQI